MGTSLHRAIVATARAPMPSSCMGSNSYYRVVVLLVPHGLPDGWTPKLASARAVGVCAELASWERLYKGTTAHCAFERACREARALADEHNDRNPPPATAVTPEWYENLGEGACADQLRRALAG